MYDAGLPVNVEEYVAKFKPSIVDVNKIQLLLDCLWMGEWRIFQ